MATNLKSLAKDTAIYGMTIAPPLPIMFNKKGQLIGLAFDGNWEAMSSDLKYEPSLQRCIGVDIRYVLFLIDKYGKASNIIGELNIIR